MNRLISISGCRTTKIYCRSGCPPGRRTKPENRVYFKSRKEARQSGYRACKVCKPDDLIDETFLLSEYHGPLGVYLIASSRYGIVLLKNRGRAKFFTDRWKIQDISIQPAGTQHLEVSRQLDAYFEEEHFNFTIPLDLRGTPFQRQVWDRLKMIPWGRTRTYGQIAADLGRPNGARAVGRAVGTNPISIVVPCHRIIGSDGSLTGYGGGLERKSALLNLEGVSEQ
jgi:O-6-methylguanine DNA methyltransferase